MCFAKTSEALVAIFDEEKYKIIHKHIQSISVPQMNSKSGEDQAFYCKITLPHLMLRYCSFPNVPLKESMHQISTSIREMLSISEREVLERKDSQQEELTAYGISDSQLRVLNNDRRKRSECSRFLSLPLVRLEGQSVWETSILEDSLFKSSMPKEGEEKEVKKRLKKKRLEVNKEREKLCKSLCKSHDQASKISRIQEIQSILSQNFESELILSLLK